MKPWTAQTATAPLVKSRAKSWLLLLGLSVIIGCTQQVRDYDDDDYGAAIDRDYERTTVQSAWGVVDDDPDSQVGDHYTPPALGSDVQYMERQRGVGVSESESPPQR